jgi:hypothetical protein
MKPLLLLFFVLIVCGDLHAQDSTLVTIKVGSKVTDVLTPANIYYYTEFTDGTVVLKDGTKVEVKMNYSRLFDQMLFIGPKGDTLAIGDEKNIKFISIGQDKFYYDGGYIRIIADSDFVKLAEKQVWVVADIRKMGTHNTPKNTVAIESFSSYTNGSDAAKSKGLVLNEEILLRKETQYYFGDAYSHFVRSGKKKLLSLFPKDEKDLEKYLNENKVNFDKKEDLEKLVEFLSGLY